MKEFMYVFRRELATNGAAPGRVRALLYEDREARRERTCLQMTNIGLNIHSDMPCGISKRRAA